jgi:hypothetical protein
MKALVAMKNGKFERWPRVRAINAAQRRTLKMHWRFNRRTRDIDSLLRCRFGAALPNNAAGLDAARLIAQHFMRLKIGAEDTARRNLRLWAPWLTPAAVAEIIEAARIANTPSAAQLGKAFRVTADEVATLGLETMRAFTVTLEQDRNRQARRRRKTNTGRKRGRPALELSPEAKLARQKALSAARSKAYRASRKNNKAYRASRKNTSRRCLSTASCSVTEFSVTQDACGGPPRSEFDFFGRGGFDLAAIAAVCAQSVAAVRASVGMSFPG